MANIKLPDGQQLDIPDDIASDDEMLKNALAPYVPDIRNAKLNRSTSSAGLMTVNVVKQAGTKGYELNPNHPVTSAMHDQWHKIVALLLHKSGEDETVITVEDIERFGRSDKVNGAVVIKEAQDGLHLRIVAADEAERIARREGGLPA